MRAFAVSPAIALLAVLLTAVTVAAQTPDSSTMTATPSAAARGAGSTVAASPSATSSATSTPAATTPGPDTMVVTALVPVPPGTRVSLQALNVATIKGVECASTRSVADAAPAGASRVTFTVERATCIAPNSGNLRICWSDTACENFTFEGGKTVDLGLLPLPQANTLPNPGGGPTAHPLPNVGDGASSTGSGRAASFASVALVLFAFGAMLLARGRLGQPSP